jgi:broad specificity phosphatase PhoE
MGQIYLVRHGQASFGAADYDNLSPLGVEQARLLGQWFAQCGVQFQRAISGNLKRHKQTAQACLGTLGIELPVTAIGDFDEYDHDDVLTRHQERDPVAAHDQGNTNAMFEKLFREAMTRWMGGANDADYRESWPAFKARCVRGIRTLIEQSGASQSTVVFTSGGTIAVICQELMGLSDKQAANLTWSLANSSVTRLLYKQDRVSLNYLNNFAHLELAAPKSVTYR